MIIKNSKNIRLIALIFIFACQRPIFIKADFKDVTFSLVNQAFSYKEVMACLAGVLALYTVYRAYIYYKVHRAETILDLKNIPANFSKGFYGSHDLFIRSEAMARVFKGIQKHSYWGLQPEEKKELSELVTNSQVIQTLIARQELSLITDISNASQLHLEDTYYKHARALLNLPAPTRQIEESKQEQEEVFKKLNSRDRQYIGLKSFTDVFCCEYLDFWQQHSTYLKDDLRKIAFELKK